MGDWKIWLNEYQRWDPLTGWSELERTFEALDKDLYLALSLKDETKYMKIYAGDEERMLVAFTNVALNQPRSVLYDRSQTEPIPIYSLIDGQVWEHLPPEVCVSKSLAKETLKYFYETKQQFRRRDVGWGEWPDIWELRGKSDEWPLVVSEWSQIEAAIDAMDNTMRSHVSLSSNKSDIELRAEGGNEGRVEVIWTDGYDSLFVLMDRTQRTPVALRLYNKIRRDVDPMLCVDKSLAKRAFKHFYETLERDDTLHWVDWSWYM
jgi:hypothetical protein